MKSGKKEMIKMGMESKSFPPRKCEFLPIYTDEQDEPKYIEVKVIEESSDFAKGIIEQKKIIKIIKYTPTSETKFDN